MRKLDNRGGGDGGAIFYAIVLIVLVVGIFYSCVNQQTSARNWGGDMTIILAPGEKLEEITWKDDDLWYLTRPMREDEVPETHTFRADTVFGVFEGTVTIEEQAPEGAVK